MQNTRTGLHRRGNLHGACARFAADSLFYCIIGDDAEDGCKARAASAALARALTLSPPIEHVFRQQVICRQPYVFVSIQRSFQCVL